MFHEKLNTFKIPDSLAVSSFLYFSSFSMIFLKMKKNVKKEDNKNLLKELEVSIDKITKAKIVPIKL